MLKMERKRKGLTQSDLAAKLHTNKTAISRIENHAEDIKYSTLEKYAKALVFFLGAVSLAGAAEAEAEDVGAVGVGGVVGGALTGTRCGFGIEGGGDA